MIKRPKPISQQVKELLWERIRQGEFDQDGRLPSEEQLAKDLVVSRATVRTALSDLARDGLITRKHGDGTYVNRRVIEVSTRLDTLWEFTQLIRDSGRKPSIQVLEDIQRLATPFDARTLNIEVGSPVITFSRIFKADDHPVILSKNTFSKKLLVRNYPAEAASLPILSFLSDYCGQSFAYAIADISAALVDERIAQALERKIGTPLLKLDEIFYNIVDQPLVLAENFYDDKVLRLRVVRSRP